jgi:hypothetical protein
MKAGAMSKDNKIADRFEVSPAAGYAGDVTPAVAWKILGELKDAILIDVRTRAEWNYVGVPDLAGLDKKPGLVEWQVFPSMQVNPDFGGAGGQGGPAALSVSKWGEIGRGGESHGRGRIQYVFQCSRRL